MKLLSRTIITHSVLSLIVFLIAIPFSYFLISHTIIEDVDEDLAVKKIFIQRKAAAIHDESEIKAWQKMQDNIDLEKIQSLTSIPPDRISFITLYDSLANEWEPYRELHSIIFINQQPYDLKIRVSFVESEALTITIVRTQVFIFLGLVLGLILINRLISKKLWKDFYQTLENLKNYKIEETSKIIFKNSGVTEFKELNEVITRMTNKIHADYLSMKQFTENASHEIQTPLSIIKNRIELILQDDQINSENLDHIKIIYEAGNKLSKVNQALILLSKLENRQFNNYEKINIKKIIEEKLEIFSDRLAEKKIRVNLDLTDSPVLINLHLAQILISNLLANAIKHNYVDGTINISLAYSSLFISNTGEKPLKPIAIFFERFQKHNQHSESLGLGLSIVKEICDHEEIEIIYEYHNGMHTINLTFKNQNQLSNH